MTLSPILLFLILSLALACSQSEKTNDEGGDGIDRKDPGNSFWYFDDPIDPNLTVETEKEENDDGLFDDVWVMSVEFIISVHDGNRTKEQRAIVAEEGDVTGLSLAEWLMSVTNDCTPSLITFEDTEVLPETPMVDLCKKGDKVNLNIIRLDSPKEVEKTNEEVKEKTNEDRSRSNDEVIEKREKGFFKKFKSAASKMLIGGSIIQEEQSSHSQSIFGSTLDESGVQFVEVSCEYLCNPENQIEGLFRISGSSSAIKYFRATMDSGKPPAFIPLEDAHNAASLLKMYLRELPQPIANSKKPEEPLGELEQRVIAALLRVMRTIDANKELTLMDLPNLALVLGPSVIWDPEIKGSFESSADSSQLLLQMAEGNSSNNSSEKEVAEDEGYFIIPNEEIEKYNKKVEEKDHIGLSSREIKENKQNADEINELWTGIEQLRMELEEERQERRQLADLILPQLEKTQLDLISALSSLKLKEYQSSEQDEQMKIEDEEQVKPKKE